jgi:hypothetical protein
MKGIATVATNDPTVAPITTATLLMDAANPDMRLALLYQSAFDRLPDTGGLAFWKSALTSGGETLQQIASQFTASQEFATLFGAPDNAGFVKLMYENTLGRTPDTAGDVFWTGSLDTGALTKSQVLVGFAESPENLQLHGPGIINGGLLNV